MMVASKSSVTTTHHRHCFEQSIEWWSWDLWFEKASVGAVTQPILFCVQGSISFVNDTFAAILFLPNVDQPSCIVSIDLMEKKDVPGFPQHLFMNHDKYNITFSDNLIKSRTVSHFSCGGVTKDKRRILAVKDGVDLTDKQINPSSTGFGSPIRRVLFHILDTTQNGKPVPPRKTRVRIYDKDSTIPIECLQSCWVHVPSVFSKSNVFRKLTLKKILLAKDLPVGMIEKLSKRSINKDLLAQIIKAAPSKILWESAEFYFTSIKPNQALSPQLNNDNSKRIKSLQDNTKLLSFNELLSQDNSSIVTQDENQEETADGIAMKAVKADDAEAEDKLWNKLMFTRCLNIDYDHKVHAPILDWIREKCIMKWYRISIFKSFMRYVRKEYGNDMVDAYLYSRSSIISGKRKKCSDKIREMEKDIIAAREVMYRCCESTFWEWDAGSRLIFWRWPKSFQKEARDGTPIFISDTLPKSLHRQRLPNNDEETKFITKKLHKVQARGYVAPGHVCNLTNFFAVPKGTDDIRMVYDATKSGLNAVVMPPNFFMPSIDTCLRSVVATTWSGDIDLGEMFLNYMLPEIILPYVGIDVTDVLLPPTINYHDPTIDYESNSRVWYRWLRCMMGFCQSPYNAIKASLHSEEIIRGDRRDETSPFFWDCIVLNLPGHKKYNPSFPWVYKWDSRKEAVAGDIVIFVDDIRPTGNDFNHCERIMHTTASRSNYLGQQDAPRKRRLPSQSPGLWSGSLIRTDNENVFVSTSQSKWNKGRSFIFNMIQQYVNDDRVSSAREPSFDYKFLEKGRGFLVHLSGTYPSIKPRLKGLHQTLETWRNNRDEDGWKIESHELTNLISEGRRSKEEIFSSSIDPRQVKGGTVTGVKRLRLDLLFLGNLFNILEPPNRLVRGKHIMMAKYGFGDASGSGFGASWTNNDGSINYRYGTWGTDAQNNSSNYRELNNLVETLEHMGRKNELMGVELFIFTDNSVAEGAYYKGNSTSRLLFDLILRLTMVEMRFRMKLHLIHVAGTRMITQGTDGLSRGIMLEGVMKGENMLTYVPLDKSALDVEPSLKIWLQSWLPKDKRAEYLTPAGWFERGHDINGYFKNDEGLSSPSVQAGTFVWAPPPAAAEVAIQELRKARHKRQKSLHVFICPRLLKPMWFKQASKAYDMIFDLKAGHPFWPSFHHEPLIVIVCFPYLRHKPWLLRHTPPILGMERLLRKLWQNDSESGVLVLRKLCLFTRTLETMSSGLVWQMLHSGYKNQLPCSTS